MDGFDQVCLSFGRHEVLRDLSFGASPGECVVFAGPNGAGKSTALALAAGILKPDSGEVRFPGTAAYVPQDIALFEDLDVIDNLRFFARLQNAAVPEKFPLPIDEVLHKRVSRLSGGMKKRVSIDCALLGTPPLVLLDEPCASLDLAARDELTALVEELKREKRTVLYAGHDPVELERICDRLVLLGNGQYRVLEREEIGQSMEACLRQWLSVQGENPRQEEHSRDRRIRRRH